MFFPLTLIGDITGSRVGRVPQGGHKEYRRWLHRMSTTEVDPQVIYRIVIGAADTVMGLDADYKLPGKPSLIQRIHLQQLQIAYNVSRCV